MNKALLATVIVFGITACGVKGKPLPPLEPPPIGIGEPTHLNKKDEKKNYQKR
jgi:predicted small lipoprotein YifL